MQIKFISPVSRGPSSLLRRIRGLVMMVVLAGVALMFSAILLAVILTLALFGGAYLWWKTRELRRMMRSFSAAQRAATRGDAFAGEACKGHVIEGEVIRVDESRAGGRR